MVKWYIPGLGSNDCPSFSTYCYQLAALFLFEASANFWKFEGGSETLTCKKAIFSLLSESLCCS